ncbi:MAG TPA: class I SAM-dependent methyltransferase [Gemmatimonadaceae bacterium]|nr:class I SAM-dependent methyltransferase [Gemmatimonadaceae bacterium]
MATTTESKWISEPFRLGTPEQFARVRELFVRTGFEEAPLCARAGVESIHDFPRPEGRSSFKDVSDPQSLFVSLFLDGEYVARSAAESILSADDLGVLEDLGLIHPVQNEPSMCSSTIAIYPVEELYIASDRRFRFESTSEVPPADVVFSPMTRETHRFLRLMPRESCNHVLDLCTGTGIAGLIAAARFARRATLVDIAERSARFAEFNVALNGLTNVRVLQGDVFSSVGDEQFDVIIAHPPYVPALQTEFVFRDAGEDGEHVTRQMVAGLAEHLAPGGQFFCECMLTDREGATLEQRLRTMLGDSSDHFDVVVVQGRGLDPLHFFADQAKAGYTPFERLAQMSETLERLRIQQLVFCSLLFQRRSTDRPVITTRRALSPLTGAADLQWVLRWMVGTSNWDAAQARRLLASRPRTLPHTELRSRSMLHDGQWSVDECQLVTLSPFAVEAACPNWYATLLQFCDGRMTAREHLQYLRDTRAVPDAAPEDLFAMMIRQLVDAGLIEIEEFRLPDSTAMRESVGVRERPTGGRPVERAD